MAKKIMFLPKEHGAYAEVAFPLVTGLCLAVPTLAALSLAGAAVAFFLAHEPVAILLGARGMRLKDQGGRAAWNQGRILLAGGTVLGVGGVLGAGDAVWPWILLPVASGAGLAPLVLTGRQKSVLGELLVVTAFSSLLLPLAGASGADPDRAAAAAVVWWISFALGTLEVHAIKARNRSTGRSGWTRWASPITGTVTFFAATAMALGVVRTPGAPFLAGSAAAVLPPALVILTLSITRVHARHLKRVGWTLVGANTLALVILLAG